MTLQQYINEILLNNHSLRAGIKSVEADYYSVLAAVATQRLNTSAVATGQYATKQQGESNVLAGSLGLRLTERIDISKSFDIDAQVVGHIEEGPRSLTIRSEFGEFNY